MTLDGFRQVFALFRPPPWQGDHGFDTIICSYSGLVSVLETLTLPEGPAFALKRCGQSYLSPALSLATFDEGSAIRHRSLEAHVLARELPSGAYAGGERDQFKERRGSIMAIRKMFAMALAADTIQIVHKTHMQYD